MVGLSRFLHYLCGFRFFQPKQLNSDSYEVLLTEVLSKIRKHIILIQDAPKYPTIKAIRIFFDKKAHRLTVYNLPSYSPDYNPVEKLWKKIKEIHLHYSPTFDCLKN